MERYKVVFEFMNGNEESSYFTENPSPRVNDWLEREKGHWIRLENAMINMDNINVIRISKVKISDDNQEEFIEWI
ncbi:hypothetical protein [Salipaludibacillus daqingensis]|uniref:hypothetical protein n=1 Tax=Salipaludibacillus daqingensis TaxID=3041001 RepID=UPI0024770611|nr:hypothetical protein [Salipaludibacillus daqingensis]